MRHAWFAMLLASAGCNSILGIDELSVGGDAGVDAPDGQLPDAPPGFDCYGSYINACFPPPAPTSTIVELSGTLSTDADTRCVTVMQANNQPVCAIYAGAITIAVGGVQISGTRPLVLVATNTISIGAPLEARSVNGRVGPGGDSPLCPVTNPGADSMNYGGGGGAGATFGTSGGAGGAGQVSGGGTAAPGGNPFGVGAVTGLRGGCKGGRGGKGKTAGNNDPGDGGSGGGAIYLFAGVSITITSALDASGAGGAGAKGGTSNHSGGGGGGSGGMIVLEAPTITIAGAAAMVYANGGGGGEGTRNTNAAAGTEATAYNDRPQGGTGGSTDGGDGGDGAYGTTGATVGANGSGGANNEGGGGGGGGGAGIIRYKGTLAGAEMNQVSPAPTALP